MFRCFVILFVLSLSTSFAGDTTRFVVLMGGKKAGYQLRWTDRPGTYHYLYEYNDRGRGPKLKVEIATNEQGIIKTREEFGHDYYKAGVKEFYVHSGETAQWKNNVEEGQKTLATPAYYSPLNSVPGEIEVALKYLVHVHGHEMDALPSGVIKAAHVKNHVTNLDGLRIELELYAFTGSGGPPAYYWFTPKKDFFASIAGWMSILPEGHEELIPELKKLQDQIETDYYYQQAARLTKKPKSRVVINNVRIFDPVRMKAVKGQSIAIEHEKITFVGKSKKLKTAPSDQVIDGGGKMALPGLWDNHAHYDISQGLYHLAAGVTNIKDLANSLDLPETRKKVEQFELLGPDISTLSGFVDFAGPFAGPTGKIVKTLEEGLAGIDYYADQHYDQVKLYSSIPPDWVKPLAERAHQRGMKVVGHVPSFMTAERAIRDGYDQIIHMNMVMLNFLGDTLDTRSMLRFIRVAERARNIDVNSAAVQQFVALLKERKIVVDPTLAIFEQMFTNEPGKLAKGYDNSVAMLPADFRRALYVGGLPTMKGNEANYRESFANMLRMLQVLHKNGVPLVPGTDDFPGFTLHRELELYVQAGMKPGEALRAATLTSAQVAGKESELGTIAVGKNANLILVEGDPTINISDIRKVDLTIKRGKLFNPKELYQSYGFGYWK